MLEIIRIYLSVKENKIRLVCDLSENNQTKQVWFEVDEKWGKYLCTERCDAFVIGLLNYALRKGYNIQSSIPITEDLLYHLNEALIPSLTKYDKALHSIKILAPQAAPLANAGAVGTGLSGGVDSFHAIIHHTHSKYSSFDITHLCVNNVGAFGEGNEKNFQNRKVGTYQRAKKVAASLNLPLIETNSNFAHEFLQNHLLTHTYSSVFAVYCLQKLWKVYFYASSGFPFNFFSLDNNSKHDSSAYELLSLQCFSHSNLTIYSEGGALDRLEKIRTVANHPLVQKHLHVCLSLGEKNCGKCSKCRRTILNLYALNELEKFHQVFDIQYFKQHKTEYFAWLYMTHLRHDPMNKRTYLLLKREIGLFARLTGIGLLIVVVTKKIIKWLFK